MRRRIQAYEEEDTWSASSASRPCHPLAAVVHDTFFTSCTAGCAAGGGSTATASGGKYSGDSSGNMHLSCCLGFRV